MRAGGPDVDGGLGIAGPRELGGVRRFSHEAMATVFEVYAVHRDGRYAAQAAQAAFDLLDRLEREMSRFLPNSDITRVNHLAAGQSTRVSPSTLECLVIARHMFELTEGAFDVSIGTGLASLEIDPDECSVRATRDGVRLDLGGVGKGYAVDRMAELLDEWGLGVALVHGGFSSVLALEPPPDRAGWPLTLSDPGAPSRVLARLEVRQTALGASGLRKGDHILDPRTGVPVRGRLAAWVAVPRPDRLEPPVEGVVPSDAEGPVPSDVVPSGVEGPRIAAAAVTDALTTAFMLLDAGEIEGLCARTPGLEAWVLRDPGEGQPREAGLLHFGAAGK
jgi:thiamine biosynthesis lipoprotein